MKLTSRQHELYRVRRIKQRHPVGHCAVAACIRPLMGLGKFCYGHSHRQAINGSAYHKPIEKTAQYRATYKAVWPLIDARYKASQPMLREMRGLLDTLPPTPRQGSTRGMKPRELAKAILWHIKTQRDKLNRRWPHGRKAERLILVAAIAAECCPKPCSSPQYRKSQVARAIRRILRTDKRELYGRKFRVKISMQGKWTQQRLWELIEPIYRYDLERIRSLVAERLRHAVTATATNSDVLIKGITVMLP